MRRFVYKADPWTLSKHFNRWDERMMASIFMCAEIRRGGSQMRHAAGAAGKSPEEQRGPPGSIPHSPVSVLGEVD